MNVLKSIRDWPFLQEPLWRWFIMAGAFIFIFMAWGTILAYMKE